MSEGVNTGQAIGAIFGEAFGVAGATALGQPELAPAFGILGAAAGSYAAGKLSKSHTQHKQNKQNTKHHNHIQGYYPGV